MPNISLPSLGHQRHLNAYLLHFSSIAKHKYTFAIIVIVTIVMAVIVTVMIQNSAATTQKIKTPQASVSMSNRNVSQPASPAQSQSVPDHTSIANSEQTTTQVKVNNQTIPVPENGSVEKTITSSGGNTNVNVSVNSTTSGSSHTSSSTSLHVNTNSQSQSIVEDSD